MARPKNYVVTRVNVKKQTKKKKHLVHAKKHVTMVHVQKAWYYHGIFGKKHGITVVHAQKHDTTMVKVSK